MVDGTWTYIPVQAGFAQGCTIFSVFVALVLESYCRKSSAISNTKQSPASMHKVTSAMSTVGESPSSLLTLTMSTAFYPLKMWRNFVICLCGLVPNGVKN